MNNNLKKTYVVNVPVDAVLNFENSLIFYDNKTANKLLKNREYIFFFLNQMNNWIRRSKFEKAKNLSTNLIRSYFPVNYKECERYVKDQYLQIVKKYWVGHYSNKYKVYKIYDYKQSDVVAFTYTYDEYRILSKRRNSNSHLAKHLLKCFNYLELNIDLEKIISENKFTPHQLQHLNNFYSDFKNRNWRVFEVKKERGGRLFSTVNMMNKEFLRHKMTHKEGIKLCELDMSCSQLFFLAQLLKSEFQLIEYGDLYYFIRDIENGTVYERIINEVYKGKKSKKIIKEYIFSALFTKWNDIEEEKKREIKKPFGLYPEIWDMIEAMRKKYENLAIKLQCMESEFFVDYLCKKKLLKEKKFFIPVHDSVIVKECDKVYVNELVLEYFEKIYGVKNVKLIEK